MTPLMLSFHIIASTVWVGGMFFAHQILRPAALELEVQTRLALWARVFARFFSWVWGAIIALTLSGYWMIFSRFGGFSHAGGYVNVMHVLGIAMIAIFFYVYFRYFSLLKKHLDAENYAAAGTVLNLIRRLIGINIALGMLTIVVASGGRLI